MSNRAFSAGYVRSYAAASGRTTSPLMTESSACQSSGVTFAPSSDGVYVHTGP